MLSKVLIILLFMTSLYSKDINIKDTANNTTTQYKQALQFFNKKNYQRSYDLFNILFIDHLDDAKINFYLGRSAFELKKYNEAIIAYERVLFQKPNNIRVKLELARSFLLYKSYDEAKRMFNTIKNTKDISSKIIKLIDIYLEQIESRTSKHSIDGVFIIGYNDDSNINNTADPHTFGSLTYTDTAQSAKSHQEIFVLNYKYKISDTLINKNNFLALNKSMFNNKHENKDLRLYKFAPSVIKTYSSKVNTKYGFFTDSLYENKINTLKSYGIHPTINYRYNNTNIIKSSLKYKKKKYQQSADNDKDSSVSDLSFSITNIHSKKVLNTYSTTYSTEKKDRGTRTDISNRNFLFSFQNKYMYKPYIALTTSLSYKETKYDEITTAYAIRKKNKLISLGLSGTYIFNSKFILQTNVNHYDQNSNIKTDVYNKNTFAINLLRSF